MNIEKKIDQQIIKFITEQKLIDKNDKILVALSGGPDSVFLLYFLNKYKRKFQIFLGAFHLNHKLRGKDAEEDLNFCREYCNNLGVNFFSANKNVAQYSKKNKISIEEAGREIRYSQLAKIAKQNNFNKIATAHISDDNAETVLLNLIKGTGLKGISGIPIKRGNIIRPILFLTKNEVLNYLTEKKTKFRIDVSNTSLAYERNFLRHEIIPLIRKKINPSLEKTLFNSSQIFRNQYSAVKKFIVQIIDNIFIYKKNELTVLLAELKKIDEDFWGDLFKHSIERNFAAEFKSNDLKKIQSLILNETGKSQNLSDGLTVYRERESLVIKKNQKEAFEEIIIHPGEKIKLGDKKFLISEVKKDEVQLNFDRNTEYISADKITDEFLVRKWKHGDKFHPFGMRGSKKVSDFLNEQKIDYNKKAGQFVLINNSKIIWVIGLRIDNNFKITENSKKVLKLCLT